MQASRPSQVTIRCGPDAAPIHVQLAEGQDLQDCVAHCIHTHGIPSYLSTHILSALMTATATAAAPDHAPAPSRQRSDFVSRFEQHTLQYHSKLEEDIFPRAYHTLVHCPIEAMYNTLLGLEQDYAMMIQEKYMARERVGAQIKERQSAEIDASSGQTSMTDMFSRHVEEMEIFEATWASDILQMQETQRHEYRLFVVELYEEYQRRLAALADEKDLKPEDVLLEAEKSLDGKEIVSVAADRVRQKSARKSVDSPLHDRHRRPRQSSSASNMSHISAASSSNQASPSPPEPKDPKFRQMVDMGFSEDQAETALGLTSQNVEHAIALLLEDPGKVDETIQQQQQQRAKRRSASFTSAGGGGGGNRSGATPSSPAHSRTSSMNEGIASPSTPSSRRQSLQRGGSIGATLGRMSSAFLQQQKQAIENTKLGGWLGKAMENFIDHNDSDPRFASSHAGAIANTQQPVESFTISLGPAQIKSTHNLRLLVADAGSDIFNPMPYDPTREMAYKAQTSTNLYTHHLSAMIVLVELSELNRRRDQQEPSLGWRQYRTGKGSNKALFQRCQHSTEFHFPDIESQLTVIEQDFASRPLQEGCFFITRHSNLPTTQVIFHLVVDSQAVTTVELSKQSSLVKGLLNIMRITTRYDISSLSIPLLLLPDRFLEQPEQHFSTAILDQPQQHLAWLQKRGEVTMKAVRGFLYEHSGNSSKRVQGEGVDRAATVFGGGLHNVEFLLPDSNAVFGGHRSEHHPASGAGHHHQGATGSNNGGNGGAASGAGGSGSSSFDVEFAFQQFRILLVSIFQTC